MLFNSFEFLLFFPLVTALYFRLPHRWRWMLLLAASYFFYMCWKPAYLALIVASTLVDYGCALGMARTVSSGTRRLLLVVSLCVNLGLLFTFKYLNFFAETVAWFLDDAAAAQAGPVLDLLLPVGISFYTFQTLSYTIDVYRGQREPERRLGIFALYVSFFPQLVAGPIERSTHLLPQFDREVSFDERRIVSGLRLMLWGMFKKVVVADTLSALVDPIYDQPTEFQGPALVMATLLFAVQILCDFSGYSDIAIGSAHVLGFDLMDNFRQPYRARSLQQFWQRWHISLMTWFRDYLFLPLGGSGGGVLRSGLTILTVFVISGLWHGANWTFVVWGALHGSWMFMERWTDGPREKLVSSLGLNRQPKLHHAVSVLITFTVVCLGWCFFRAKSLPDAWFIVTHLGAGWGELFGPQGIRVLGASLPALAVAALVLVLMVLAQTLQGSYGTRTMMEDLPAPRRWAVYYLLTFSTVLFFGISNQNFIYFQF